MLKRDLERVIEKAIKTFPAVVITGPRQAGKTTMLRNIYAKKFEFRDLEDLDTRQKAISDPRGFLEQINLPVVIDEIQYAPDLLSYIKTKIDQDRKPGQWIVTSSQQFELMRGVSESLAGRAMILTLFPLSYSESARRVQEKRLSEIILRGGYPELVTKPEITRDWWCSSYVSTYLSRDVRDLAQVGDLRQFEIFVRMCAVRTGTILNLTDMARDVGISPMTAKRWLSILEIGGQAYLLYPYYKNLGKRLVKSPKIYFTDTALATYLMGMNEPEILENSPYYGALVETFVVVDMVKKYYHLGKKPELYYLRTQDGVEADIVIDKGMGVELVEVKSSKTIVPEHGRHLKRLRRDLGDLVSNAYVVADVGSGGVVSEGVEQISWREWVQRKW